MSLEQIVLGGGCFWCLEAAYQLVNGVEEVKNGYAGGTTENPSYWDLHKTGNDHAEVVEVTFDTNVISLKEILEIFFVIHDPTTVNRQGNDRGPEYRSIILYNDERQKQIAQKSIKKAQELWPNPIVTEITKLSKFYVAEAEQQNYFINHPEQAYCQIIINPKLAKLQAKFANKLNKER